jgi:hypothetical protein
MEVHLLLEVGQQPPCQQIVGIAMLVVGSWWWDNHPHTPQGMGRAPNEVGALLGTHYSCQCQQHCLPRGPFAAAATFAVEPPLLVSLLAATFAVEPPLVVSLLAAPIRYSATYSLLATHSLLAAYSLLAT